MPPWMTRPRVLFVDDFPATIDLCAELVSSRGFSVALALDGREALRVAPDFAPDVIVLDLAMPHLDGLAAIRALSRDPRLVHTSFVLFTAHATRELEAVAKRLGVKAVVSKTSGAMDLVATVVRLAALRRTADNEVAAL